MRIETNTSTQAEDLGPNPTIAKVLSAKGHDVVLAGSNLTPSRPGFQGDLGEVEGIRVLHVEEAPRGGLVHLLRHPMAFAPGQLVEVRVDPDRRSRLARTHAACVLVQCLLERKSVRATSIEIQAGEAWIEVDAVRPCVDLNRLALLETALHTRNGLNGQMTVEVLGDSVQTVDAPISKNSIDVVGVSLCHVEPVAGGLGALHISLPEASGRWWR